MLPGGHAGEGARPSDTFYLPRPATWPSWGSAGLDPGNPVQRLLLHVQRDAEPCSAGASASALSSRSGWRSRACTGRSRCACCTWLSGWPTCREPAALASRAVKKLWPACGIAVHYGCHLLRPQPAVSWDDALAAHQGRDPCRARWARAWSTTRARCSAAGARSIAPAQRDASLAFCARHKLSDLADQRCRRARRGVPELLPAVRPQPGGPATRRELVGLPVLYLSGAASPWPTATRPRRSA